MVEGGEMHKLEYAAQSPDELALIKGARSVGVIYCKRTAKVITIEKKKRRHPLLRYKLIDTSQYSITIQFRHLNITNNVN